MIYLFLQIIISFLLCFALIPQIIAVSTHRELFDTPNQRSVHQTPIPILGGIGIICSILITTSFTGWHLNIIENNIIFIGILIHFMLGVRDDLLPVKPLQKLGLQVLVGGLMIYSGIHLTSLQGVFGVYEINSLAGTLLSLLIFLVVINAYNLIDGINGLAGAIALVATLFWGIWFSLVGQVFFVLLALSSFGAVAAFLYYNVSPAKIFMGDSGSISLGFILTVLFIQFLEVNNELVNNTLAFESAIAIGISVLFVPLFDFFRVFFLRLLQRKSPFLPDKNHIHHLLLKIGYSQLKATISLVTFNVFIILATYLLQPLGNFNLLALQLSLGIIGSWSISFLVKKRVALPVERIPTYTKRNIVKKLEVEA